ncbi:MAG: Hsp20/alpha crystallin family protein [archaeon GB-1867-035]|nr:Hsp20/alpha crystallin family protein [Candidatus Culexmicrobium profundum]
MHKDVEENHHIIELPGAKIVAGPGIFIVKKFKTVKEIGEVDRCCRHHIEEDIEKYTVKIEMPGVKKDDIKLYVSESAISLNAKPSIKMPWTPETYKVKIKLANSIDSERVKAKYESGILIVELPKKKVPREVEIE